MNRNQELSTRDAINDARAHELAQSIKQWGRELGFAAVAICDAMPHDDAGTEAARRTEERLRDWLDRGFHGTMDYMARHGMRRARPAELVPGTVSVITVRMDYLPEASIDSAIEGGTAAETHDASTNWVDASWNVLHDPLRANVSRYAHGRDYHKVLRTRLQRLSDRIAEAIGPFGHRVFTDSAPVMEVELAQRSGLGWRGKHTLLLSRTGGSMFFLGELFLDLPLPADLPASDHCGRCTRCIEICPTRAIVAPHVLDARRCIAYLTIELEGPIPEEYRPLIGNRIYGCDDCQLVCPWNKFAQRTTLPDFDARPLAHGTLVDVFAWSEDEFLAHTEGTAIRRIGHERWLRNVAVALGNALASDDAAIGDEDRAAVRASLEARRDDPSTLVREHVAWAVAQDRLTNACRSRESGNPSA